MNKEKEKQILLDYIKPNGVGFPEVKQAIKFLLDRVPSEGYWSGECCSVCGTSRYNWISFHIPEDDPSYYVKPFPKHWNFCPGCGSDMSGKHPLFPGGDSYGK